MIAGSYRVSFSSVQFSRSVMSDSLRPHELQHARLPCSSLSPRICSNSCPLSQLYYLNILSSATPFSFCLQSFPASGTFPESSVRIRWPKHWSLSFSISPSNECSALIFLKINWFDSLLFKGFSGVFSSTTVWKHQFFGVQPSLLSNSHICTGKTITWTTWTFCKQSDVSAF